MCFVREEIKFCKIITKIESSYPENSLFPIDN